MSEVNESQSSSDESSPLSVVWHRYGDQLRRRARTRLRQYGLAGQAESMDICNDVMADLTRRYQGQSLQPNDILAYIHRAIDNQVLDTFRGLARQCRDFRRNEDFPVEEGGFHTDEHSPSQVAIRKEVFDRIRQTLGPADCRGVDMMLENRNWNEIGEQLGVPADAARMRVRRAIERVRKEILADERAEETERMSGHDLPSHPTDG